MNNLFNLIDENWIPCQLLDGTFEDLGLYEVLANAQEIKTLVTEFPMEKVALSRLLLAILHRNFGPQTTSEWQVLWKKKKFDGEKLGVYFEKWHDRFNLFDEYHPFYQSKDIDAEIRLIIGYSFQLGLYHFSGGNNATLFDHHTINEEIVLSAAKSARLLVNAQSFCFGFSQPGWKDGPSARGVNFLVQGETLFHTLMMNLIRYDQENPFPVLAEDLPAWERDNAFVPERTKPDGYLDYLSWQSRKILLHPDDLLNSVRLLQVTKGLWLDITDEPYTKNPMMQYSRVENTGKGGSPFRPLKFQEGRAIWRDSTSIIEINSEIKDPPMAVSWISELKLDQSSIRMNSIGISSDQGKVNFYLEELFTFPAVYLEKQILISQLKTCLEQAEVVRSKLWGSVNYMAEILLSPDADRVEGRKPDRNDKQKIMDHIFAEDQYWAQLEVPFYQLLNDLPEKEGEAIDQWHQDLRRSVWSAFDYAGGFLGNSPGALKARALGGRVLGGGLKNLFSEQE